MTDRELMQIALKYLEESDNYLGSLDHSKPIAALRNRLAQPQQEPVAWGMRDMNGNIYDCISAQEHARAEDSYNVPLYNRRQWQGLTETEQVQVAIDCGCADVAWLAFARAIEAKLKEKNA